MYLCVFYLFNLFCGIVLEKEKEKFFIQLNQTQSTSKETLKILVELNIVMVTGHHKNISASAGTCLQAQLLATEAVGFLSLGVQGQVGQHRKTKQNKKTPISGNMYIEGKSNYS